MSNLSTLINNNETTSDEIDLYTFGPLNLVYNTAHQQVMVYNKGSKILYYQFLYSLLSADTKRSFIATPQNPTGELPLKIAPSQYCYISKDGAYDKILDIKINNSHLIVHDATFYEIDNISKQLTIMYRFDMNNQNTSNSVQGQWYSYNSILANFVSTS